MGKFDAVKFDFRMPDGYAPHDGFYQTKDLECTGNSYVIEAGRLRRAHVAGEPAAGDVNFNGMLNIYTCDYSRGSTRGVWHEYNLEFVDGALKIIYCDQSNSTLLFEHCDPRPTQKLAVQSSVTPDSRPTAKKLPKE